MTHSRERFGATASRRPAPRPLAHHRPPPLPREVNQTAGITSKPRFFMTDDVEGALQGSWRAVSGERLAASLLDGYI